MRNVPGLLLLSVLILLPASPRDRINFAVVTLRAIRRVVTTATSIGRLVTWAKSRADKLTIKTAAVSVMLRISIISSKYVGMGTNNPATAAAEPAIKSIPVRPLLCIRFCKESLPAILGLHCCLCFCISILYFAVPETVDQGEYLCHRHIEVLRYHRADLYS